MPRASEYDILKYNDGVFSREKDLVVEECRAEIYVNGRLYVSVMATPAQLDYLAVGYLFTEGAIKAVSDIKSIDVDGLNVLVEVRANPPSPPLRARSSGFGLGSVAVKDIQSPGEAILCRSGGAGPAARPSPGSIAPSLLNDAHPAKTNPPTIMAERITELMEKFNQLSELFWKTGAVHSAWLVKGERRYFSEDVGRHNALDKVIGQYLSDEAASDQTGLIFTTGRISTEMLLKTAKAGMDALISRGSASALAVELAEKFNIILIGFSRGDQFKAFWGGQYLSAPANGEDANE